MNRKPNGERRDGDLLSQTAPLELRSPVDETQSTRQGATAPQPKIASDDDVDEMSAADLDEAWAGLTAALRSADEDFDAAAAYARLSNSLPPDLTAIPLVERAPVRTSRDVRLELRNLVLGLVAMGTVCAGLASLAIFGPGFERRSASGRSASRPVESVPRPGDSSIGAGQEWQDVRWEEDLLAIADELHFERHRFHDPDRGSLGRTDEAIRLLERDFAQARDSFGSSSRF